MICFTDGVVLYHGSYMEISEIDISKCSPGLDFGRGFYLTSSFEQALGYIPATVKKNIRRRVLPENYDINEGRVSVYRFHLNSKLKIHLFPDADVDWLHYVASNRSGSLFGDEKRTLQDYDIIGGKIANDSTATLLNAYVSGDFGEPGSERADTFTISGLLPDRLKDQFCFKTEISLDTLEFLRSERYGDYNRNSI